MNCQQCNAVLQPNARFCPNCGSIVDVSPHEDPLASAAHDPAHSFPQNVPPEQNYQQANPLWAATQPVTPILSSPWAPTQDVPNYAGQSGQPAFQGTLPYYQANIANDNRGTSMSPDVVTSRPGTRPRRRLTGCVVGCLSILVLLLLVVGAGWVFLLRPYLHTMAQDQLNRAMTSGVNQIPQTAALLPPGPLTIGENSINNLIVLNLAPSDPIKNPSTQITPDGIRISVQVYGFSSSISAKPALQNGRLVATNVKVDGPISLIMTPAELTPLLNQHLSDAQDRLKHPLEGVQLKNHEMDLTLGSPLHL